MKFFEYLGKMFQEFPTDLDSFTDKPTLPLFILFLALSLFKKRFKLFFVLMISALILVAGWFYGIDNPVGDKVVSTAIFAGAALLSFVLVAYNLFLKN